MRKQTLLLMALLCAALFTGCKKKEAIDLSSLHTTAAVEKETLPPTTESTTEAAEEDSSAEESGGSKGNSSQYSFKTDVKTYTQGNASVQYPLLSNMKDSAKEKKANELLKQNAIGVIDAYPLADGQSLSVKASVISANLKRITVVYTGEVKGASGTNRIFYCNTIDLDTMNNLRLGDFADAYTMAGYIHSGDYKLESVSGADESAIRSYINSSDRNLDYYYKALKDSDFSGGYQEGDSTKYTADTWPKYFSYEKQGVICVSIPLPEELGGYVLVKYSPDSK